MLLSCRALTVSVVAAVLLVTNAAAGPTFSVAWDVPLEPGFQTALVSQGIVFQTNHVNVPINGSTKYECSLIATSTANQSLWTLQSSGPLENPITVQTFSAIPKLIFVLFNNMQPPNISAVIPTTGTVVWSTLCPLNVSDYPDSQYYPTTLVVSPGDASVLYWFTENPISGFGLTALDAEYGTVLWSESIPVSDSGTNTTQPLQCGSPYSSCLGVFSSYGTSPVIVFLDGRTRAVLAEVTVPGNSTQGAQIISVSQATPDVVLVLGVHVNAAINTTNFAVLSSWSTVAPPAQTLLQPMPPGSPTSLAVVETGWDRDGIYQIYSVDLFTGNSLWIINATALCPCENPAAGCAYGSQVTLPQAPFNGVGDVLAFEATCSYNNNRNTNSVGLMDLTTGSLVKSVDTKAFPGEYWENVIAQIGPEAFVAANAFYNTDLTVFAVYPPANSSCTASALSVEGNTAVFQLWCSNGTSLVVAGVVSG